MRVLPAANFLSANPHFAKSALGRFTPADFIALVDRHGIAWHEKTLGQLFCDGSSRQIVAMLLEECAAGRVETAFGQASRRIDHRDGSFHVGFGRQVAQAPAVVLASGGLSIPKLGATSFAYDVRAPLRAQDRRAATGAGPADPSAGPDALFKSLSGVSANVVARAGKASFARPRCSPIAACRAPRSCRLHLIGAMGAGQHQLPARPPLAGWLRQAKRDKPRTAFRRMLGQELPDRLAETLADQLALAGDLGNIADRALEAAEQRLAQWRFVPDGSEGFAKAEVTIGGISTAELSSRTMESQRVPGLFAIGEAVDVTGWLGGYNFQWAWASAHGGRPEPVGKRPPYRPGAFAGRRCRHATIQHSPRPRGSGWPLAVMTSLTSVQTAAAAEEAQGRDLIVSAKTGSGKTVAFGLAIVGQILEGDRAPWTRERAGPGHRPDPRIGDPGRRELEWPYAPAGARRHLRRHGPDEGTPRLASRRAHRRRDPGRLRDHLERGAWTWPRFGSWCSTRRTRCSTWGFAKSLRKSSTPPGQQADFAFLRDDARPIVALARRYQKDALRIETTGDRGRSRGHRLPAVAVSSTDIEHVAVNVLETP